MLLTLAYLPTVRYERQYARKQTFDAMKKNNKTYDENL